MRLNDLLGLLDDLYRDEDDVDDNTVVRSGNLVLNTVVVDYDENDEPFINMSFTEDSA